MTHSTTYTNTERGIPTHKNVKTVSLLFTLWIKHMNVCFSLIDLFGFLHNQYANRDNFVLKSYANKNA